MTDRNETELRKGIEDIQDSQVECRRHDASPFSRVQLEEAHRQIASTLRKLHGVVQTLSQKENPSRYKSQITLAKRRIEAFGIADELILRELKDAK